ncbi:MAG: alpha/beta hydrolase [Chloroflexota bacterium]|nr:alpha/beta hydrolase [Chloroflexota bacterium]
MSKSVTISNGDGVDRRLRRQWHVLSLFLVGTLLASSLAPEVSGAARAAQPEQPAAGPGGRDYPYDAVAQRRVGSSPAGAYVFMPADRAAADEPLPLVIFIHGFTAVNPDLYGGWIEHLVRRGSVVVYPDYQTANPLAGGQNAYLGDMMVGIRAALVTLDTQADGPVVVVGHSMGGILAVNYAARAENAGFPAPDALMVVEPGACRNCGGEIGFGVALPASPAFSDELRASIVVGDESVVGDRDARWIWGMLEDLPPKQRSYVRIRSDRHGSPALVADHQIPLTLPPGTLNALDWNGVWRLLDLQIACLSRGAACGSMFGPGDVSNMGRWSDGEPVTPLVVGPPEARSTQWHGEG